ncbi:MAG: glycine-rich protein [bacterium]|nr:glycine-rich protein [bacterium]
MAITKVGESQTFSYTGTIQIFVAPYSGKYRFVLNGGNGGTCKCVPPASRGGQTKGTLTLEKGEIIYVVVGGNGGTYAGGYNGGGTSQSGTTGSATGPGYVGKAYGERSGGGGATHIARRTGLLKELVNYKNDILMVAGGAGGNAYSENSTYVGSGGNQNSGQFQRAIGYGYGGVGGGNSGARGTTSQNGGSNMGTGLGYGATQTAGGKSIYTGRTDNTPGMVIAEQYERGSFGQGGGALLSGLGSEHTIGAAGGGGWYGGGAGGNYNGPSPGGGGSGYINPIVENGVTTMGGSTGTPSVVVELLEKSVPTIYLGDLPVDALYIGDKEVIGLRLGDKEVG